MVNEIKSTKNMGWNSRVFHFVGIQFTYFLYLQSGLEIFNKIVTPRSKVQLKHFYTPMLKIWNIGACSTHYYLLILTICKFPDMTLVGKLQWRYPLINGSIDDVMNVVTWIFLEILSGATSYLKCQPTLKL